jgi:hypothetical protein
LTGWRWSGLLVGKQVIVPWRAIGLCDGARAVDFLDIFDDSDSRTVFSAALKAQYNQPHTPRPTAVLLSRRPKIVAHCTTAQCIRRNRMRRRPSMLKQPNQVEPFAAEKQSDIAFSIVF